MPEWLWEPCRDVAGHTSTEPCEGNTYPESCFLTLPTSGIISLYEDYVGQSSEKVQKNSEKILR